MSERTARRRVNWRQAVAEVLLILVGIIIALAVDSWWSDVQEEKEARAYLEALLKDFEQNRRTLVSQIELQKGIIDIGADILAMIENGLDEPIADEFFDKLGDMYLFGEWAPAMGTYEDLVGSGRLLLISNLELRNALSTFQRHLAGVREFEGLQSETYYENQAPFVNRYWDATAYLWNLHSPLMREQQPPKPPFESSLEPFESQEFWNLVVAWMWVHADVVAQYTNAVTSCDRIIELIQAELVAGTH